MRSTLYLVRTDYNYVVLANPPVLYPDNRLATHQRFVRARLCCRGVRKYARKLSMKPGYYRKMVLTDKRPTDVKYLLLLRSSNEFYVWTMDGAVALVKVPKKFDNCDKLFAYEV